MFESKTQITGDEYHCADVAGRLYLWQPKGHKATRLIISAHGIRGTTHSFKITQDVRINFYSHDKNSVIDPGLRKFYEGKAKPIETLARGATCYNYILSKYTNSARNTSHNQNNETYDGVQHLMDTDYMTKGRELMGTLHNVQSTGRKVPLYEENRKIATRQMKLDRAAILTIRNRRFKADVNLEWVLNTLGKNGHSFKVIDCLFCRNTVWTALVGGKRYFKPYADEVPVN